MRESTAESPTVATLRLGLSCHPLREGGTEPVVDVSDIRYVDGGYVALVWMTAGDATTVADSLSEWNAVRAADVLSAAGESRLLRLELAEDATVTAAYEALVAEDVLLAECTGTAEGWEVRLTAPSHGALTAVYDRWQDLGIDLEIVSVGGDTTDSQPTGGLTDSQREALVCAAESGYFSVPRQATLRDVAEQLDISDQAVSERVRRGTDRLVQEIVSTCDESGVAAAERGSSSEDSDDERARE